MDKFEEVAATIIDMVELKIRKIYPVIDKIAEKGQTNTLLYGEHYYDLENEIAELLRENFLEKKGDSA